MGSFYGRCHACGDAITERFDLAWVEDVQVGGVRRRVHRGQCHDRLLVLLGPQVVGSGADTSEKGGDMDVAEIASIVAEELRGRDDIASAEVTSTGALVVIRTQGGTDFSLMVAEGRP